MGKPLVIDFYCGLGGWSKGFLAQGYDAIGFDLEVHHYGDKRYPGQLVLQDVLTVHGSQVRDAAVLVANVGGRVVRSDIAPKFGEYARAAARGMKFNPDGTDNGQGSWFAVADSKERGGQKGRSNFHFFEETGLPSPSFHGAPHEASVQRHEAIKNGGGSWFNEAHNTESGTGQNPVNGVKRPGMNWSDRSNPDRMFNDPRTMNGSKGFVTGLGMGHDWRQDPSARFNSKSSARKAASALIAEIPFDLANYVAKAFKPA